MDISNIKDNLMKYLNLAITNNENEFEARFLTKNNKIKGNKINSEKFNNVISYLLNKKNKDDTKKYTLITNQLNNISLDITFNTELYLSQTLKKLKYYRLSIYDNNYLLARTLLGIDV